MEATDIIKAQDRAAGDKGVARRLRTAGRVPGIVYGPGVELGKTVSVDPKDFEHQRKTFGVGHLYSLDIEGGENLRVLLKDMQRHPVKRTIEHVDFYAVNMKQEISLEVRLELTGKPKGAIEGGILNQLQRRVLVTCLPGNVPTKLTLDVSNLDINDVAHLSDIAVPEGVEISAAEDEAVARVAAPASALAIAGESDAAAPAAEAKPAEG